MDARAPLTFAAAPIVLAHAISDVSGEGLSNETSCKGRTIEQLLSRVPDGTSWQQLTPNLRADD
jgi:hypothetical protein